MSAVEINGGLYFDGVRLLMSPVGPFETCQRAVTMSVLRGRAEVVGTPPNRRD
jgi:hypothetical protein